MRNRELVKDFSGASQTQDQINAVSLLARLELAGVDVGSRWTDVADHLALRLADHVLPFLDLQYLYGLARAGRMEAARTLHNNIAAHAATRTDSHERTVWQQVCVPAAHGLLAHAQGDWATAVEKLGVALPRLVEIGGSHAQRDLFHQIWLDALQRNGQWAAVQNVLQPMVNGQPESVRLARQVGVVNEVLGLPVEATQGLNLLETLLKPGGLGDHLLNAQEIRGVAWQRASREALGNPALAELLQHLPPPVSPAPFGSELPPLMLTRLDSPQGELSFLSTFTTFGMPQDITLSSLRIEHLIPADGQTWGVMTQAYERSMTS